MPRRETGCHERVQPVRFPVLHKTGYASSSSWKFWNIKAIRTGNYKVRYDIGQGNGHYLSFWYTVRSHH